MTPHSPASSEDTPTSTMAKELRNRVNKLKKKLDRAHNQHNLQAQTSLLTKTHTLYPRVRKYDPAQAHQPRMFRFPRANVRLNSKTRRHKQPTATTVLSSITFHMNAAWNSDTDASLDSPTYLTANNAQTSDDLPFLIYMFDSTPLPYRCRCQNCLTVWNYFISWTLYFAVSFPMKKLSSWKKVVYLLDIVFCCNCPDKNC